MTPQTHPATATVRVRAFVETWRTEAGGHILPGIVVNATRPDGSLAPLYLADLAALVGDPEPPEPPMPRDPQPELPDRDPSDIPW